MEFKIKEKISSFSSIFSSTASFLGGYQVCHNVCLGIIAVLSLIGITVVGMPLLFLTKIAVPMWIIAVLLFIITFSLYIRKKCISKTLLLFNLGIIIAGTPFESIKDYNWSFWIVGGSVIILSITLFIKDKIKNQKLSFKFPLTLY